VRRIETVGAWLGLWTPPRGETVPPVPWRAIAVGGIALVAIVGVVAALLLPNVASNRRAADERAARAEAQRHAEFLAYVDREQRPRTGRGGLAAASAAVERDARRRTPKPVSGVECEPFPRSLDGARRTGAFDCVAVTARLPGGGVIGMNFRVVVEDGRYAFCRTIPLGDRDRLTHPLPDACRGSGS
jgi:type II secretory pathway pseudopilin PulG